MSHRGLVVLANALAIAYFATGLVAMLALSPRVPYADPWRFLARFLATPFPANVAAADNGHCEVLPNLVRVADLHWCHADQSLQIGVGTALALLALLAAWSCLRRQPAPLRAAALLAVAVGWFWLGNARKLAHGNESVSLFCVLACVLFGLFALGGRAEQSSWRQSLLAAVAGFLATFSFGAGLGAFASFAAVLALARAPWSRYLPLLAAFGIAISLLGSGGAGGAPFELAPLERFDLWLRWLGAPCVWLASPLLDPDHAARLPGGLLRTLAGSVAEPMHAAFGPHLAARWPAALVGGLGLVALARATHRHHRDGKAGLERMALGLAWFGVAVGVLVVGLRLPYFRNFPDQVTSQRYVNWSMQLWLGLVLTAILRARSPRIALGIAITFAMALAPSQIWTWRYTYRQRAIAERTAVGAAVGVLEPDLDLVETVDADLRAALPLLEQAKTAMFAWPETAALQAGTPPPRAREVDIALVAATPIDNRFGARGTFVQFATPTHRGTRLLLLDRTGQVRGIATRLPFTSSWCGYLRGEGAASLRAAALD